MECWNWKNTWPRLISRERKALALLQEVKQQLRISHDQFDLEIADLIDAAVELTEQYTGQFILLSRVEWTGPFWPRRLLRPPFYEWVSAEYWGSDGLRTNLAHSGVLVVNRGQLPAELYPATGCWPDIADAPDAVTLTWLAGYEQIPPRYRQAIKLLVSHWYENREAAVVGTVTSAVTLSFSSLATGWGYIPQEWEYSPYQTRPTRVEIVREADIVNTLEEDLESTEEEQLVGDVDG